MAVKALQDVSWGGGALDGRERDSCVCVCTGRRALTCPHGVLGISRRRRPPAGAGLAGAVLSQDVMELSRVQG